MQPTGGATRGAATSAAVSSLTFATLASTAAFAFASALTLAALRPVRLPAKPQSQCEAQRHCPQLSQALLSTQGEPLGLRRGARVQGPCRRCGTQSLPLLFPIWIGSRSGVGLRALQTKLGAEQLVTWE